MINNYIYNYIFCPEEFRFNCANYEVKCFDCGGYKGKGNLNYSSINKENKELTKKKHPYILHQKIEKQKNIKREKLYKKTNDNSKLVKKALKNEKKILKSIDAKSTIGSGRIFNDGDGVIIINNVKYYIEVKTRYSEKTSMFPTNSEWTKAINQGCKLFIVESSKGNTVTMSKETFIEILGI